MEMTFVNNYYTMLRTLLFSNLKAIGEIATSSADSPTDGKVLGTLNDTTGTPITTLNTGYASGSGSYYKSGFLTLHFGNFYNNNTTNSSALTRFGIGSGNTAVTMNDYELATPISDSDLTYSLSAATNSNGIAYNVSVRNNTANDISVAEIGLYSLVYASGYQPPVQYALLARAVLDSAVVIPAGESKTFDVSLSLALPA